MMDTGLEFNSAQWGAPPKRDIAVRDGEQLMLGDTTMTFYVTPGHNVMGECARAQSDRFRM
jgi:metallo-beta-lactamase class B